MKVFVAKDPEGNFIVPTVSEAAEIAKGLLVSSMTMVLSAKKVAAIPTYEEKLSLSWEQLESSGFAIVEAELILVNIKECPAEDSA